MVVVSRDRPAALARSVLSLAQSAFAPFEIVAVADPAGLAALDPWAGRIKRVPFGEANVSAARNEGIALAAGEVLAFLDDDAVAEPLWLAHLAGALAAGADAAAGWVRGPDGHGFAARAQGVLGDGTSRALPADPVRPGPLHVPPGTATRAEGTNMAIRADRLRALGGFDEGFRFSHDESDLFWRLGGAGGSTWGVPLAQVHHGALPSERRRADGVARSLREVGASLAVWARRRGIEGAPLLAGERERRRRALLRHMVAGRIEPRDVGSILATLEAGFAAGLTRALPPLGPLPPASAPFLPFRADPPREGHALLLGGPAEAARARAEGGEAVTLLRLAPGWARHRTRYDAGLWVQEGGLRGRSEPGEPWLGPPLAPEARAERERARLAPLRG